MTTYCEYCGNELKYKGRNKPKRFCLVECYTKSGARVTNGRVNGRKWADKFWKRWLFEFDEKYGHLDRLDQLKIAFKQGQWTAYRRKNRK